MNFQSKTEEEIAEEGLLPKGTYPFEVIAAEEKKSKSGNDMIELKLRVFTADGDWDFRDYLLEKMAYKLFHFCTFCGLATQYQNGTLRATDCLGKSGYAKIGIKIDKSGQYKPDNQIEDYVRAPESSGSGMKREGVMSAPPSTPPPTAAKLDEDVPF